jgi:thiamine pyrophosphokinase
MKKIILIANGSKFDLNVFEKIRSLGYSDIACADGGSNIAFDYKIVPNFIIGDLDSIKEEVYDFYKSQTKIIKFKRQSDTDVEKALKYLYKLGYNDVVIFSGTGDRLDHTIGILSILIKFSDKLKLSLIHGINILSVISGENEFNVTIGETISLFAFNEGTKILTKGLKYPLNNETLVFGQRESISNVAIKSKIKISVNNGVIFFIREIANL